MQVCPPAGADNGLALALKTTWVRKVLFDILQLAQPQAALQRRRTARESSGWGPTLSHLSFAEGTSSKNQLATSNRKTSSSKQDTVQQGSPQGIPAMLWLAVSQAAPVHTSGSRLSPAVHASRR